ncbi:MAG: ABC transporter [Candidatus Hydrogenedentes bacterium]|nr:ABC transporter [Candidatus Hydrogenedentota bacterium]
MGRFLDTARRARELARIALTARELATSEGQAREAARHALRDLLADARGVPMKVGQFLASFEGQDAFVPLSDGVRALPLGRIFPSIETALGRPIEEVFSEFSEDAVAASLGQVHRARLREDGAEVAVKVQYPDIAQAVEAEMRLARLIPSLGPVRRWGFDLNRYKETLHKNMLQELDYLAEAARQQRFHQSVRVPGLVIPRVHLAYTRPTVLVQDYCTGVPIRSAAAWPVEERRVLGATLLKTLFHTLFITGEVHGDPHFGNLLCQRGNGQGPKVVLMDFGCTVVLPLQERMGLLRLILASVERDSTDPLACFCAMGFEPEKLIPIQRILPALCEILLEPFAEDRHFSTREWHLGRRIDALLGELKWWFRSAGPPQLLFLLRAFQGLILQLETLEVMLNWRALLVETLGAELLQQARNQTLPTPHGGEGAALGFDALADYLKVSVTEWGEQRVAMTMPACQAAALESLIPEDVLERIRAAGLDVSRIARKACESGLVPQELFNVEAGEKCYRVWLE